jgi:GAF domain-containing protein
MIDRSDRRDARLTALRAVSHALARPLGAPDIMRALYVELEHVLDVTMCFFGLHDAPGQSVDVIWQVHDGVELEGGHFPLGTGPTSQAIRHCQPQLIRHWSRDLPPVQVQYATARPGLPESAITVPVVFGEQVIGVLSIQSYRVEAYDEEDLALVQAIADQASVAISRANRDADRIRESADLEAILASMPDGLLVLDDQARLVRLNQAARRLLCLADTTLILGHPVDRPQEGRWPLGTQAVTQQLLPIIDGLKQGEVPSEEVYVALDGATARPLACRASVLIKAGAPAGALMVLREVVVG